MKLARSKAIAEAHRGKGLAIPMRASKYTHRFPGCAICGVVHDPPFGAATTLCPIIEQAYLVGMTNVSSWLYPPSHIIHRCFIALNRKCSSIPQEENRSVLFCFRLLSEGFLLYDLTDCCMRMVGLPEDALAPMPCQSDVVLTYGSKKPAEDETAAVVILEYNQAVDFIGQYSRFRELRARHRVLVQNCSQLYRDVVIEQIFRKG